MYINGDRVRVITKNSMHTGTEGTVTNVHSDQKTFLVKLDTGNESGFFIHEIELVKALDENEQIKRIARVLYNEPGNEEWDMEQSLKAAASLYKAGIRFDG